MTNSKSSAKSEAAKGTLWQRIFGAIPKEAIGDFRDKLRKTNIRRMQVLAIYVICIQILLNLLNILMPSSEQNDNIMVYVVLSMGTLALGIVFCVLFTFARRGKIQNVNVQNVLINGFLYLYLAIQMVFCTLNILVDGGTNSYVIAMLILGLFPILRPLQSIISSLALFGYLILMLFLSREYSNAWSSILLTDAWTNLIIISGLTICFSVIIYNMYVASYLKELRLAKANDELISKNEELGELNRRLEIIANTDTMTGVANRHAFSRDFESIWNISSIQNEKLAVAIMDIDFFKNYNDKFGHLAGDECLKQVASSLHSSFRRNRDIVCRFGGEEFLVVFNASRDNAFDLVDRARQNVEALRIPHAVDTVSPYVTISAGVCVVNPANHSSNDSVLQEADEALYQAKNNGRNQTVFRDID